MARARWHTPAGTRRRSGRWLELPSAAVPLCRPPRLPLARAGAVAVGWNSLSARLGPRKARAVLGNRGPSRARRPRLSDAAGWQHVARRAPVGLADWQASMAAPVGLADSQAGAATKLQSSRRNLQSQQAWHSVCVCRSPYFPFGRAEMRAALCQTCKQWLRMQNVLPFASTCAARATQMS